MKHKHILAAVAIALAACGSINAKTADELRIYINPGHGSWTSDDRPLQTIGRESFSSTNPDTTGFFESNTNLRKGFGLLDKLRSYGLQFDPTLNQENDNPSRIGAALDMSNNIVMSHVKAGPYPTVAMSGDSTYAKAYNRSLVEIATEVEYNNFDMFISIHSNATTYDGTTTNYLLFLFRGPDSKPEVENSDVMAKCCWPYAFGNEHMCWDATYSMTNTCIRGDWDWYGSHTADVFPDVEGYLTVLQHHVPGFLVEGYFHTYQPSRQRAMNFDAGRLEGVEYGRGIADFFELTKESTGDIYGIVRDQHEKFRDDLYTPRPSSDDVYMPLNGVVVTLWKDGQVVDSYTTDNEWNGSFIFPEIEPGDYTLTFAKEQYKEIDPVAVTVEAATTIYPNVFLENVDYVPTADHTDYPDEINIPTIKAASEYNMEQAYVDTSIEELEGKNLRRTVLKGDNLYMLALDDANDPTLIVYDTKKKAVVANVSTEGMTGENLNVSDIQVTADSVLVACPKTVVGLDDSYGGGTLWFYKWENDDNGLPTGDPIAWLSATAGAASGNMYNSYAGETFAYSGTVDDGHIIYSGESTDPDFRTLRTTFISIIDEENAGMSYSRPADKDGTAISVSSLGDDYRFVLSPLDNSNIMIYSSGEVPVAEYEYIASTLVPPTGEISESLLPATTTGVSFFKYAGHSFMAAPAIEDGENVGVKLIDVTDGLDNAKEISTTNTNIEAAEISNLTASGVTVAVRDAYDDVTDAYINLFLTRGATEISKFTTQNVAQPTARGEWAYDLAQEENDGVYTLTFKSTGDAPQANVILESESGATVTIAIGEITEGENSVTINSEDIAEGTYTWKIEVTSNAIPTVNKFFQASLASTRGMVIDRNPESPYFGTYYVGDPYSSPKGIYVFNPDLTQVNESPYFNSEFSKGNTSSPYRLAINPNNYSVVITDWADAHSGLWVFDPADTETIGQLYAGDKNSGGGYTFDGQLIGGGNTGSCFYGTGEDTKLYVFVEDYPTVNAGNYLVGYDIGEEEEITTPPSFMIDEPQTLLTDDGSDVNVIVNDKGIWCAQNIGENSSAIPVFLLFDFDGTVLYNSGNLTDLDGCRRGGMAINDDFSKLAIASASKLLIYDVDWDGQIPSFTKAYDFTLNTSSSSDASYCYQMQFDQAGNLFIANRYGFLGYGLPNDSPIAVTPAKAEYVITGSDTSGVESVVVEEKDAQLRIYPNPATSTVNVEAGEEITSIALYNLAGAMMKVDATISGSSATVNVDGLAVGTYLLSVNGKTTKLIKK